MECNFRVGQKVVCVTKNKMVGIIEREHAISLGAVYPEENGIYTVREIYVSRSGVPAVLLTELNNCALSLSLGAARECGFAASWFRPALQRKTDISVFKAVLNPARSAVLA